LSGRSLTFVVPGRLETLTGGYEYDRRMIDGLRARGWHVDVRELDSSFPNPTHAALADAARQLARLPDGALVVVDGLAYGAMPDEAVKEGGRLRLVSLVHMPLASADGLTPEEASRLERSERRALAAACCAVVTGETTAARLGEYGVDMDRIAVVEPGTERAPLSRGSRAGESDSRSAGHVAMLCVATVNSGKGHDDLVRALAPLADRDWHLSCVGSLERDPAAVARLRALVRELNLDERVSLQGVQHGHALERSWDRADMFVLATHGETCGMAVAEAIAHGLPVVSTRTGAIARLAGDAAGVLVQPGDVEALTRALARMLEPAERATFTEGARRARLALPSWDAAFDTMATVLENVRPGG
jgi:glycosyltransferase involved in cell wall biosynthesis